MRRLIVSGTHKGEKRVSEVRVIETNDEELIIELNALRSRMRLKLWRLLKEKGPLYLTQIANELGYNKNYCLRQLKILHNAGIITRYRNYYMAKKRRVIIE